jgi:hypothetical protein
MNPVMINTTLLQYAPSVADKCLSPRSAELRRPPLKISTARDRIVDAQSAIASSVALPSPTISTAMYVPAKFRESREMIRSSLRECEPEMGHPGLLVHPTSFPIAVFASRMHGQKGLPPMREMHSAERCERTG